MAAFSRGWVVAAEEGQGMGAHPQLAHILSMEGAVRTSAPKVRAGSTTVESAVCRVTSAEAIV